MGFVQLEDNQKLNYSDTEIWLFTEFIKTVRTAPVTSLDIRHLFRTALVFWALSYE